jgi:hypothetical protein
MSTPQPACGSVVTPQASRRKLALTSWLGWSTTAIAMVASTIMATGAMPVIEIYVIWTVGNILGFSYGVRLKEKPIIVINVAYLALNVMNYSGVNARVS